ncbi:hypothetical protein NSZ01_05030 [Nocardioides szechwanensis]|uniref:Uncharacterized protein n=1 Tax=Nocardioides szechwanensis TaxID=1005944 RepID=A0A1G9W5I7_9ACTN|nr:hypothetical protein NSZ01_05030 [Nocardioides szechwanensis]SDM79794.1 hypothetical protein SAMN05192576_0954 [Nocardioides szechwanensis]
MTMTHSHHSHRRLDVASLALFLVGLAFGTVSYWLVAEHGMNPLVMIPSAVAATIGAFHLVKHEARR